MIDDRPLLAVVPGEPAGVGPELLARIVSMPQPARLVAIANADTLQKSIAHLALPISIQVIADLGEADFSRADVLHVLDVAQSTPTSFGELDLANAASVIDALNLASDLALRGNVEGIVTGPTHKAHLINAGYPYTGTTEWLADRAGVKVVMMLAHDALRVALVTTHLPLRDVADAITTDVLRECIEIVERSMRDDFGIATPRVAILGLNPHAGEQGALGREEIEVYAPVLEELRERGFDLVGPLPADTAFLPQKMKAFDAVIAAYHDQGLPVLKYSGFEKAVNITLGLPYPRVAVDHGTALDLAGTGKADASSMQMAVQICAQMARERRRTRNQGQ